MRHPLRARGVELHMNFAASGYRTGMVGKKREPCGDECFADGYIIIQKDHARRFRTGNTPVSGKRQPLIWFFDITDGMMIFGIHILMAFDDLRGSIRGIVVNDKHFNRQAGKRLIPAHGMKGIIEIAGTIIRAYYKCDLWFIVHCTDSIDIDVFSANPNYSLRLAHDKISW